MTENPRRETIDVRAGYKRSGEPVFENLLVDRLDDGTFRLAVSPGLYLGVAAGDVVEFDQDNPELKILERGGNLCVQVYGDPSVLESLAPRMQEIGGSFDGGVSNLAIFTVSVRVGFPRIEAVLNRFVDENPGVEWYFGNVYDPNDGVTPLNWW